jgi:hypothetical protein
VINEALLCQEKPQSRKGWGGMHQGIWIQEQNWGRLKQDIEGLRSRFVVRSQNALDSRQVGLWLRVWAHHTHWHTPAVPATWEAKAGGLH